MIDTILPGRRPVVRGFTLVEILAALAIVAILLIMLLGLANHTSTTWTRNSALIEKRRTARSLLEFLATDLAGAVLPAARPATAAENNQPNLQFVLSPPGASLPKDIVNPCALFWQTTNATNSRLGEIAEVGYFVSYREVGNKPRFQLCRFFVNAAQPDPNAPGDPTKYTANDDFKIYDQTNRFSWLGSSILAKYNKPDPPNFRGLFADGVIGLWVRCLDPLGNRITKTAGYTLADNTVVSSTNYPTDPLNSYDSALGYRYADATAALMDVLPPALPAAIEIMAVVVDTTSLDRLTLKDAQNIRDSYTSVVISDDTQKFSSSVSAFIGNLPTSIRSSARAVLHENHP